MPIVNDDSSVISEQSLQLIENARGIIYDCHMFIIQPKVLKTSKINVKPADMLDTPVPI
jgi:hypothetical protein